MAEVVETAEPDAEAIAASIILWSDGQLTTLDHDGILLSDLSGIAETRIKNALAEAGDDTKFYVGILGDGKLRSTQQHETTRAAMLARLKMTE